MIEDIAVNTVKRKFERSAVVSTYLASNDKEPLWDGHLYVYKNNGKGRNNENLIGRIPSQVKGKEVKKFKDSDFKFSIELNDLRKYRTDGGIIFFVVQICGDEERIFYAELTPVVLANIIKQHGIKKTTSVRFEKIPDDLKDCEILIRELYENLQLQKPAVVTEPLSFEKLKNLKTKAFKYAVAPKGNQSFAETITSRPIYLYAIINDDLPAIPMEGGPCHLSLSKLVNEDVAIDNKIYFNEYRNIIDTDFITISVGDCLKLSYPRVGDKTNIKTSISFNSSNKTLSEAINILEFIKAFSKSGKIKIGSQEMAFRIPGFKSDETDSLLNLYVEGHNALKCLGCNEELILSDISADGENWLRFLSEAVKPDNNIEFDTKLSGPNRVQIGNVELLIFFYNENNHVAVKSIFDKSLEISAIRKYPEGKIKDSVFGYFNKDEYLRISNIPYKEIVPSYNEIKDINPYTETNLNNLGLLLISVYDEMPDNNPRKKLIAETVVDICNYLYDNCSDKALQQIYFINKCQMYKRIGNLPDNDEQTLTDLLYDPQASNMIKCASAIMLQDKKAFDHYWKTLDDTEQKSISEFPIWKLKEQLH